MGAGQDIPLTRVLIIEDSERLAVLLADALRKQGFAADAAHSLAGADDALAAARYDAIILDLGLPDGDGLDWLKQKGAATTAPVLALTARATLNDRVVGLDAGVDDYSRWRR
jgi:two-component system response regulator QseB